MQTVSRLAPGFRFHPTDEELVRFYLKRKVIGNPRRTEHIAVVDIYKSEPWDLPSRSAIQNRDMEWYFFTNLDKKYGNGSRTNRATEKGYWKTTGKDRCIGTGGRTYGMKKTLVYHLGRAPHGDRSNWVMHEYRMADEELAKLGVVVQEPFVLCRIFEKSGSGPKNGEKYGAPFVEEDWVDDEDEVRVEEDLPLAAVDKEILNEGSTSAGYAGGFVEALDFEQELDTSVTVGSAGPDFPSSFYYGECSSHPGDSQGPINDQQLSGGDFGVALFQNDQPYNVAEQHGTDTNSLLDAGNGELSHDENALNFDFGESDLYFDAAGYALSFDDEYLETNDLLNVDEGHPAMVDPPAAEMMDPSAAEMIDEYLTCPDEDISKYISFDFPQDTGSESPIANHGEPLMEQSVEGETNGSLLANKHVFEDAQSSKGASSKQNPEPSNLVSGDTNPFVKQANKWLAGIPAAPAFASEFPTKKFALGVNPAAESSNSAHITAGMISITDITFRGNAMDWMVGKNGGFSAIMSTGFSQPGVNSATLVPISGLVCSKTAFVLSHGWVFLMGFSVLILSMSFKIGSFMYTGK